MSVKLKSLLIFATCFLALFGCNAYLFSNYVFTDFLKIELSAGEKDAVRFYEAFEAERRKLEEMVMDWAQWDDSYRFMVEPTEEFRESWSTYESYAKLQIAYTAFFDLERAVPFAILTDFDHEEVKRIDASEPVVSTLRNATLLFDFGDAKETRGGVILHEGRPLLVASSPILNSNRDKESRGTLVIARWIDEEFFAKLASQTQLTVKAFDPRSDLGREELIHISSSRFSVKAANENTMHSRIVIRDFNGTPATLIRIQESRPIYLQAVRTREWLQLSWLLASAVAVLVAFTLLDNLILRRLRRIGYYVERVRENRNFDERIDATGSDELAKLGNGIDAMLKSLSTAHHDVKVALQAAEVANASKSQFLASVSHELRTPIHGMLGLLRILYKNESSSAKLSYLQMAYNTTESLLDTINDLLDMSKAEAGRLTFEQKDFRPRHVVREVLQAIGPRAHEKERLEVVCTVDPEVPNQLHGDPYRLRQVMANLLGNAIKFTNTGTVTVSLRVRERQGESATLELVCRDTGIGIASDQLAKVFEPYAQADASKAGKPLGTGLGLHVVRQIAQAMEGRVDVESVVGQGTTFTVQLPFRVVQEHTRAPAFGSCVSSASRAPLFHAALRETLSPFAVEVRECAIADLCNTMEPVVLDGKLLREPAVWALLEQRSTQHGSAFVVLMTSGELMFRERLEAVGIRSVLVRPCLGEDIIELLTDSGQRFVPETSISSTIALPGLSNLRILVADDSSTNQVVLVSLLEDAGHTVKVVEDGIEMVEAWESGPFDLILTDIQMPRLDGLGATTRIRDSERTSGITRPIPIVAITAHAFEEERTAMLATGVTDVITKPIDPTKLRRAFANIFADRLSHIPTQDIPPEPIVSSKPSANHAHIDFESVLKRCGGRSRIARRLIQSFVESAPGVRDELLRAVGTDDRQEIASRAHALKGLVLDVGCSIASQTAAWMESHAGEAGFADIIKAAENLSKAVDELLRDASAVLEREEKASFAGLSVPT